MTTKMIPTHLEIGKLYRLTGVGMHKKPDDRHMTGVNEGSMFMYLGETEGPGIAFPFLVLHEDTRVLHLDCALPFCCERLKAPYHG